MEIKISIPAIDDCVAKLTALQKECSSFNSEPPATVGGGKTVNELEKTANLYKSLNDNFAALISDTVAFLNNVKDSYVASDIKAAKINNN